MPAQREVDEAAMSRQVEKFAEGIRTRDLEGLKQLYAANVVSFDVEPPLPHVGIGRSPPTVPSQACPPALSSQNDLSEAGALVRTLGNTVDSPLARFVT